MAWEVASSDVRRSMGVSSDVRGLGRAIGVSLVVSSDVRRLGGAMGVALAMPEAWEVMSEASSDVRRAMGVSSGTEKGSGCVFSDVRGVGSDVRGQGGVVGVVLVTSECGGSDVRGYQ